MLRPLDEDTVLASVRRTHRAVLVDEDWRSGSLSAEVAARITEEAFYDLDAPVERLCAVEVPIPYARTWRRRPSRRSARSSPRPRGVVSRG